MNKADDILERLKGQQPMIDDPDALTEQIMRSIEASPILADGEEKVSARTVPLWRWLSIAASILFIIGIGVTLWPTEEQESKSLVAETTVQPKVKAAMPEEPKVEEIKAEPTKRETAKPRKQKQKPKPITLPSAPKPLLAQESAPAKAAGDMQLAVSHEPKANSQKLTAMSPKPKADSQKQAAKSVELTESDIPITRPENYKYTPEEIALLKKQANEAYLKWVELELEIAKHCQEQTAQQ